MGETPTLSVDKEKALPIGVWLVATGRKLGRKGGQRRSGRRHTAQQVAMANASEEVKRRRYEEPAYAAPGQPKAGSKRTREQSEANILWPVRHPQRSLSGVKPPPTATENEQTEQGKGRWLWSSWMRPAGNHPQANGQEDHPRSKGLW